MSDDEDVPPKLWFEENPNDQKSTEPISDDLLIQLRNEAKICYDNEVTNYNAKNSRSNSNYQWMKTMISKGTVSDKIAAYIVSIQDSPIHNLELLSNLVSSVKVGKKKEYVIVMENLVELFLESLLPPSRQLLLFKERPLSKLDELSVGNAVRRKKYLVYWYFEDCLKEIYATFVQSLNVITHDTVDNNKEKSIGAMYKLLANNAEQEQVLLRNIVNKIGDPSKKVASKTVYCLSQLLHQHSNMQGVVLNEVEKLLFRSNISPRAQYYALCFLSQFYLSHESQEVAQHLIEVYFSFFKACIKKGEVNGRMMSVLLMGVNRAYPYAKLETEKISEHVNTVYRIVHVANFNVGLHALALLYQVSNSSDNFNERFYSALYRKLLDPQIYSSTHQAMFLSLLFKVLSKDVEIDRIKIFIKRLLQVTLYAQPSLSCGLLYMISHLLTKKPHLNSLIVKSSVFAATDEDDEEERYTDVKDTEEEETVLNEEVKDEKNVVPGWVHLKQLPNKQNRLEYDAFARNPLYAGGQFCYYTELQALKRHFHPTVALYANNLLDGENIKYSGDPLKDFSLIRFLDRFAFKNPKKLDEITEGCHPTFGKRKKYVPTGTRSVSVKSNSYLNKEQDNIPVEEFFLYTYLKKRYGQQDRNQDDESDVESVASDEFEEMLNKMTDTKDRDDEEEELDYMDAFSDNSGKKTKSFREPDSENEEEIEEDASDMEIDDLTDDDDDASDLVFDSEEETNEEKPSKKKKSRKSDDAADLFADADEFAALLEEEGSSKTAPGGSGAWSNKDNSNIKQISWEDKRNHWLQGHRKKNGKKMFNKKTNFSNNTSKKTSGKRFK